MRTMLGFYISLEQSKDTGNDKVGSNDAAMLPG